MVQVRRGLIEWKKMKSRTVCLTPSGEMLIEYLDHVSHIYRIGMVLSCMSADVVKCNEKLILTVLPFLWSKVGGVFNPHLQRYQALRMLMEKKEMIRWTVCGFTFFWSGVQGIKRSHLKMYGTKFDKCWWSRRKWKAKTLFIYLRLE